MVFHNAALIFSVFSVITKCHVLKLDHKCSLFMSASFHLKKSRHVCLILFLQYQIIEREKEGEKVLPFQFAIIALQSLARNRLKLFFYQAWWCTPVIQLLGRLRQKDRKCEGSLSNLRRPCL